MMTVVPGRMGLRAANGMERYIPSLSNDPTSLYRRYEPHLCAHDHRHQPCDRFTTSKSTTKRNYLWLYAYHIQLRNTNIDIALPV
ncbi:hypothetical protein V1478_013053 [Vespula squamosa]|uniref:Uncharacterized protein n=1 Tax=Vespula squamosa TaxID=30214 RepID=A0ABD2A9Q4_VESSQ